MQNDKFYAQFYYQLITVHYHVISWILDMYMSRYITILHYIVQNIGKYHGFKLMLSWIDLAKHILEWFIYYNINLQVTYLTHFVTN